MAAIEERVSRLEGAVQEHSYTQTAIRESLARIEAHMDQRFIQMDSRFIQIDQRFMHLEQRWDARLDAFETRLNWVIGVQITSLIAIAIALITRS